MPDGYFGWAPNLKVDPYDPERAHDDLLTAGGLEREAAFFCEGEKRFGCLFRDEGQVDVFAGE